MSKKLTYDFVKESFEREGYILLSSNYTNNYTKLNYICPNGHKHSIRWNDWQKGVRCPHCYGNSKPTIGSINKSFKRCGYKLLTKKYINARQKLDYICPKYHKYNITWNDWRSGSRCPYCSGKIKKTIEFIKYEFAKENYVLLSDKYINNRSKLEYICPNEHKHSISWNNWCKGYRCPYCVGLGKPSIEFIKSEFAKEDYKLLTTKYKNAYQKLEYICKNGHKYSITWGNWSQGRRCPYCIGIISRGEIELRNFIKSLGIKVSPNDRYQIFNPETGRGLELDIFMPAFNKAIEYNGEYWHLDKKNRANNDLLKQKLCRSKSIDLLIIWDKEWKTNSEKCKNKVMSFVFN
jgi:hypothetical protein